MWYKDWFQDDNYLAVYGHRDEEEARVTVDLFEQVVHPAPNFRILDLACGNGRHAIEFARRGYRVTGTDLSSILLERAQKFATEQQVDITFIREDMRHLSQTDHYDAVVNLFTSFGYFKEDDENDEVIASVARALVQDGWFMLDFLNAEHVKQTLNARDEQSSNGSRIIQERYISDDRINKKISIISHDELCATSKGVRVDIPSGKEYFESVRLFTHDELINMFHRHGFEVKHQFGNYDATEYSNDSPRLILFGKKK